MALRRQFRSEKRHTSQRQKVLSGLTDEYSSPDNRRKTKFNITNGNKDKKQRAKVMTDLRRGQSGPLFRRRESKSYFTYDGAASRRFASIDGGGTKISTRAGVTAIQHEAPDKMEGFNSVECRQKDWFYKKFRLIARVVLFSLSYHKYIKNLIQKGHTFREQMGDIDRTAVLGIDKETVFFDPADFKANRQMRISSEARRILQKIPSERTEQEIYYAMIALRGIKLIADYPVRMQRLLAQNGLFERYDRKRAIVKQGHRPTAFYFILFGTVIVAVTEKGSHGADTKCYLTRGDSFGELAIINRSSRQSTVLTKTYVEMLSISVETYERIFMVGGAKNINDPDHNEFMEGLYFLKGWPKELLENNPKRFLFTYFKRDAVMVKDTNYSDWIFIVKSGSVQILKKLVKTSPTVHKRTGRLIPVTSEKDRYNAFKENTFSTFTYSEEKNTNCDFSSDTDDEEDIYELGETDRASMTSAELESKWRIRNLLRAQTAAARIRSGKNALLQTGQQRTVKSAKVVKKKINVEMQLAGKEDRPAFKEERRTYLDDLDAGYKAREHIITEADLNPMFVHVQTLTKGEVFGLESLVFGEQPSFCLVSNGAECIMINRTFYRDHCPQELLRSLRSQVSPYPADQKLQSDLLTRINWDTYKNFMLADLRTQHKNRKEKRHQCGH